MAQKVQVMLIDDLDGEDAEETVEFALDGISYEIDLSEVHSDELHAALAMYISSARRVGGRSKVRRSPAKEPKAASNGTSHVAPTPAAVRAWAASQPEGFQLSDRGRIPAAVMEAFLAANPA